ncbi:MAG: purine phosphatase [Deinococcus sp.]|nr:purine phosphatase [Deinococcus sp.]
MSDSDSARFQPSGSSQPALPQLGHPDQETKFAVYLCPPAASDFYRVGSGLLGFDVRAGQPVPMPEFMRSEWQTDAGPYGFHLTVTEAFSTDPAHWPDIEAEVRACVACLSPGAFLGLSGGRVEAWEDGKVWVQRLNASPALTVLQTLLSARLAPYVSASPFDWEVREGKYARPHEQARMKLLHTPRGLDSWQPHFTLVQPYSGSDPERLRHELEARLAPFQTQSYGGVTLFERRAGEQQWRVRADIPLLGAETSAELVQEPLRQEAAPTAGGMTTSSALARKRVVVATGNPGKVREIEEALSGLNWQLDGIGSFPMPEETGVTYEENAAMKACAAAITMGRVALADDSGLEVEVLDGEPGVYSARYGNRTSDLDRNMYLLERLRGKTNRRAKFVSVVILAYPDGHLESYRGEVPGVILEGPRGEGGFGYDPLFVPDGETRTLAEMTLAEKRALSHRGRALAALMDAHRSGEPEREVTRLE